MSAANGNTWLSLGHAYLTPFVFIGAIFSIWVIRAISWKFWRLLEPVLSSFLAALFGVLAPFLGNFSGSVRVVFCTATL
jgi:hypothetical protein